MTRLLQLKNFQTIFPNQQLFLGSCFWEKVPPYCLFSRLWIQVPAPHLCAKCPKLFRYSCFFLWNDLLDVYTSLVIFLLTPWISAPASWLIFKAFVFLGYILHSWWNKSCSVLPSFSSWTQMFLEGGIQHTLVSCFTKFLFLSDNTYHRILSNGMVVSRISF